MNANNPLLTIIMPVFNEQDTIAAIVHKVFDTAVSKQVIIVNDGSADGTADLLGLLKNEFAFKLITHAKRLGKGASIIDALSFADGEYTIIQDADLEYEPADYFRFFDFVKSLSTHIRVIYGSRFLNKNGRGATSVHSLANSLFTFLTNLLFHAKLTDVETGYKFIETDLLKALNLSSRGFDVEIEITAKLLNLRVSIYEIPIRYTAREVSQGKKIRFKDGIIAVLSIIKYRYFAGR